VESSTLAHAGKAVVPDLISHELSAAPRTFSVVGVTDITVPKVPAVPVDPE